MANPEARYILKVLEANRVQLELLRDLILARGGKWSIDNNDYAEIADALESVRDAGEDIWHACNSIRIGR